MTDTLQKLGGRTYRTIKTSTLERDIAMMIAVREAGLGEMVLAEGEAPAEFAHRLYITLLESGKSFEILGGILIPSELADTDWTPALGHQTAATLRGLTDPAEKRFVQSQIVTMVTGFFEIGLPSLKTFRSSLGKETKADPQPDSASAATEISAIGR